MNHLIGQNLEKLKQERDSIYQSNIKKSRLYGVYIPVDLQDAIGELKRLSDEESLRKYKNAPEDFVVKKLFFGVGRWMSYNWNFEEGSRMSLYLYNLGLRNPDDMVEFMLRAFHRELNFEPINESALVAQINEKRAILDEEQKSKQVIIKEESIKKTNE